MNTASTKTTKIRAGRETIYRKCTCGETAHDLRFFNVEDPARRWAYVCRNCFAPRYCPARVKP